MLRFARGPDEEGEKENEDLAHDRATELAGEIWDLMCELQCEDAMDSLENSKTYDVMIILLATLTLPFEAAYDLVKEYAMKLVGGDSGMLGEGCTIGLC